LPGSRQQIADHADIKPRKWRYRQRGFALRRKQFILPSPNVKARRKIYLILTNVGYLKLFSVNLFGFCYLVNFWTTANVVQAIKERFPTFKSIALRLYYITWSLRILKLCKNNLFVVNIHYMLLAKKFGVGCFIKISCRLFFTYTTYNISWITNGFTVVIFYF